MTLKLTKLISLILVTWLVLDAYFRLMPRVETILDNTASTTLQSRILLQRSRPALDSFTEVNERTNKFTKQQMELFNSPYVRRQLAQTLKVGPDARRALVELSLLLREVRQETLTALTLALKRAADTLENTGHASGLLLSEGRFAVADLRDLLHSEQVQQVLVSLAVIAKNIEGTSGEIKLSAEDIRKGIPPLVASFTSIATNAEDASEKVVQIFQEFLTYAKGINQPLTGFQKILAFLAKAVAQSLPVLIRR